jgi:hypothetical protein
MVEQTSGEPQEDQHTLILASRVEDAAVFNSQGERIGHIEDLSIDRKDGRVVYAIMSFGGFLGIGKRFHPLPWSVLEYDPRLEGYVVPLDRAALESAPHYDAAELRKLGGPNPHAYDTAIVEYYRHYPGLPMM